MTLDEPPRGSRSRRSHRKRRRRRTIKVIVWSFVGLVAFSLFVAAGIYIVLVMRGEGSYLPTPVRTGTPLN